MFCVKCGKELADGESFCPSCGTKLGGDGISFSSLKEQGKKIVSDAASFAQEKGSNFVSYAQTIDKKSFLKEKKPLFLLLGIVLFVVMMSCGMVKCVHNSSSYRQKKAIETVQSGYFVNYDLNTTIGQRVKYFVANPVWNASVMKDGTVYVTLSGTVESYWGATSKISVVFEVNKDKFHIGSVKLDGDFYDEEDFLDALYQD